MPLVSTIAGWAMIPAELYQGHKAITKTIPEKEEKIAQIAKDKGWDVDETLDMYRITFDQPKLNRETAYKPMYSMGKVNFGEIQELLQSPEYQERKLFFKDDIIEQYFKNKEKVPHPTLRDPNVMEGSVIDKKDSYFMGGIASLIK